MSGETEFATALAAFQAALPHVGKDSSVDSGAYSYDYADLTAITEKALPLLTEHGFSWVTCPTTSERGFVLRYTLLHSAGHSVGGEYPLPEKATPQQIGSAITYGRRYCLCAVTGIAPGGEDDDGQRASDARAAQHQPKETDRNLLADLDSRILLAKTEEALRDIYAAVDKANAEGRLTDEDRTLLVKAVSVRKDEIEEPA